MIRIVVSAFVFHDNNVLLVKKADRWWPPGGHVEKGETLGYALRRELKEETNIVATFIEGEKLPLATGWEDEPLPFSVRTRPDKHEERCTVLAYAGTAYDPTTLKIQESELTDGRWFSMEEILNTTVLEESLKARVVQAHTFLKKWSN